MKKSALPRSAAASTPVWPNLRIQKSPGEASNSQTAGVDGAKARTDHARQARLPPDHRKKAGRKGSAAKGATSAKTGGG
jgi:hypothetical protein